MKKLILLAAVVMIAGCAKQSEVATDKESYEPFKVAAAPEPCKEGDTGSVVSENGGPWRVHVCHGGKYVYDPIVSKKWESDNAEMERKADAARLKENEHNRKLYWALRTRVISAKEMDEVETYGSSLVLVSEWNNTIYWSGQQQPDNSDKRAIIFNDALLQQMKLRKLAGEKEQ